MDRNGGQCLDGTLASFLSSYTKVVSTASPTIALATASKKLEAMAVWAARRACFLNSAHRPEID
jgi:hypothetical protein